MQLQYRLLDARLGDQFPLPAYATDGSAGGASLGLPSGAAPPPPSAPLSAATSAQIWGARRSVACARRTTARVAVHTYANRARQWAPG